MSNQPAFGMEFVNATIAVPVDLQYSEATVNVQLTGSNSTSVTLANAVTATGVQIAQSTGNNKTLVVEVYGTATSFTVTIQGIGPSGAPYPMSGTNYNGLTTVQNIASAGIYQFDVTGLTSVEANVTAVSGGNVSVAGRLVAS